MTGPSALAPRNIVRTKAMTAFRHRNYRLFFAGQAISLVGTWMQQVAQAWLVLTITGGDPLWLGVVAAAQFLPVMVLGLFAGILADVLPKRQTLIAAQVVMMVLAAVLAFLTATGLVQVWHIVLLAVLLGCANAVDMPARQSFAYEMVGPRDVGNAVALNSAMFNGARVVGPAVAGLTIGLFGIATAFAINAVSFVAVIIGLRMMRDSELQMARLVPRPESVREVFENLGEGLRFVRDTPLVLLGVTVVGARRDGRHELHGHHPAARGERARQRCHWLRIPHDRVGSRRARRRGRAGHRRPAAPGPHRPRGDRPRHRFGRAGVLDVVPVVARPDDPHRRRWHHDGGNGQRDDPAVRTRWPARPRDERLHDGLLSVDPDRRHRGGRARIGRRDPDDRGRRRRAVTGRRDRRVRLVAPDRLALAGEHRAAGVGTGRRDGDRERRSSVDRAQHQRRVQAAEAERGAQHPPVGPDPAIAQETGQEPRRVRIGLDEVDR